MDKTKAAHTAANNSTIYNIKDKSIHHNNVIFQIPEMLKSYDQWLLWKLSADNKKIPLNLDYYPTDPTKGFSFQSVLEVYDPNRCSGLGFVVGNGIVAIDLDHCINNGKFNTLAETLVNELHTYTEVSQSGTGLHLFFIDNTAPGIGRKSNQMEIYTVNHYIAMTGNRVDNTPPDLAIYDGKTQELLTRYFIQPKSINAETPWKYTNEKTLQQLSTNDKFKRLFYDGNIEGYNSHSEADAALLTLLALHTKCCKEQMRGLFSQSALGKREKWINRKDYQEYQLNNAIEYIQNKWEDKPMRECVKRKDWYNNNLKDYVIQEFNAQQRTSNFSNLDVHQIFKPGLYLLGGIPGMGKTTFSYQLGEQFAANKEAVLFMSSELDINMLFMKSLVRKVKQLNPNTSMTPASIRSLFNNSTINCAVKELSVNEDEFSVINTGNMTIEDMIYNASIFCESHPQPIIIIDYLQYLNTNKSFSSDKQRIDYIVHSLKEFQKSQQSMIILLSSFNRSSYRSTVSMESFKETGDIDATADVMWGLQYDIYQNKESGVDNKGNKLKGITLAELREEQRKSPRQVMLTCIKNRFGGLYEVYFDYYADYELFVEREDCDQTFKLGC